MLGPIRKLHEAGCDNVLLTERGTFFGYHRLVNDFIGVVDLMELDGSGFGSPGAPPVCFDATHSTQLPGNGEQTGGRPERAPMLARAAVAAGVHAVFLECHPSPKDALSDAATQLPLSDVPALLESLARVRAAVER
jgi:2-dehydro-3-deoxyphosphooctonate aldolase (KDO 8-P synthase)